MINLMIVAGDKTESLAKFMEERGTFSVNYAYESLGLNLGQIKDSIIIADQLLYLYQEDIIDIRVDMQVLKDLLMKNGFFTVKEIVFVVPECSSAKKAISYFNTVMQSSGFTKYNIREVAEKPSFNDIYDSIVGISQVQDFPNTYNNVYRVERGVESKVAYEEQDDLELIVEPFNYDNVKAYEAAKLTAVRTESGVIHFDENADRIEKFDSPVLGSLDVKSVLSETESYLVTGLAKSGISTWTAALAVSTMRTGRPVTIIDFTDNRDIKVLLEQQGIPFNELTMLNMTKLYHPKTGVINICTVRNAKENSVKREFLQNLYNANKMEKGYVFIAVNNRLCVDVTNILCNDLTRTFFCMNAIESDVLSVQNDLANYAEKKQVTLILNDRIRMMEGSTLLDAQHVKKLLPFEIPVVQPINFESLDIDNSLFNALIAREVI